MAMGKEAIQECRNHVSYFNDKWENSDYQRVLEQLHSDTEYQKFITQTEVGKALDEKLTKTFSLYGQMWQALGELGDKTRTFLNAQEALNSRNASGSTGGGR